MHLLDFDGVVLRNSRVSTHVFHSCVRFMAKKASISIDQARHLNRVWYPKLGHSSRVLQERLGVPCTIEEFNEAVYTTFVDYDHVRRVIVPEDFKHARALLETGDCAIFSNAPEIWCRRVSDILELKPKCIVGSDTIGYVLKPHPLAYERAERLIGCKPSLFIDDDPKNVSAAKYNAGWRAICWHSGMSLADVLEIIDLANKRT